MSPPARYPSQTRDDGRVPALERTNATPVLRGWMREFPRRTHGWRRDGGPTRVDPRRRTRTAGHVSARLTTWSGRTAASRW